MNRSLKTSFVAASFLSLIVSPVLAVDVHSKKEIEGEASKVWEKIGGFCDVQNWHPAVKKCDVIKNGGVTRRVITLGDGATITERLVSNSSMSYTYVIEKAGPLPVTNYTSTISVMADDGDDDEARVTWSGAFDAKGVTDKEAVAAITGVYESGLKAIDKMFDD